VLRAIEDMVTTFPGKVTSSAQESLRIGAVVSHRERFGCAGRTCLDPSRFVAADRPRFTGIALRLSPLISRGNCRHGLTALMLAAANGHTRVGELLIAAGADVGAKDNNGSGRAHATAARQS
jgi:hypothetical protein